jgi:Vault protein inter-alpha-trypsin.
LKSSFAFRESNSSGSLSILNNNGKELLCPLKHTKASAQISGYIAKVTVTQLFDNPLKDRNVEAVYTFPLDEHAAVDSMTIKHGDHIVSGVIKTREEASRIYADARARGKTAALLDEERPNIFTQSIANIEPGKQVEVKITYVTTLPFEAGKFTFTFPTVVGPRFIPPQFKDQMGLSAQATQSSLPEINSNGAITYPDSKEAELERIVPPIATRLQRAGNDISIDVSIDAGCPIKNLASKLHEVNVQQPDSGHATIALKSLKSILNKDFVLSWEVSDKVLFSSYLNHKEKNEDGYLTVMLMPPSVVSRSQIAPRELVFLIDCSGSQDGDPLVKSKETIKYIVNRLNPDDTFQIVAFSDLERKSSTNR